MEAKEYLRSLAKKQLEISKLPIMEERKTAWIRHNSLNGGKPMVVMEEDTFVNEIITPKLDGGIEAVMERQLLQKIACHQLINDDKVVPDYFVVPLCISFEPFNIKQNRQYAHGSVGFHDEPVIVDLERDFEKLSPTNFYYNMAETKKIVDFVENTIGDILPVKVANTHNYWHFGITQHIVNLMGMENMFCSMYDYPDKFHQLMQFIVKDMKSFLRFQEENKLIFANNGNDYMGGGSYCFNDELVFDGSSKTTWGHLNSQETVGINPEMYREFIYPYYQEIAGEFGLLYYGCCEPVNAVWDNAVQKLPNLRKVSISPWCNEAFMAEKLEDSKVIYSRKPSPNFIGVEKNFDEVEFRKYIKNTMNIAKNCKKEFIFRDIYQLHGNVEKVKRAVEIVRDEM